MEIINQNNIYLQMNLTKHYKSQFILIAILAITGFNISLSACHFKDYKNPSISSPSGNFKISTIVNRTKKIQLIMPQSSSGYRIKITGNWQTSIPEPAMRKNGLSVGHPQATPLFYKAVILATKLGLLIMVRPFK